MIDGEESTILGTGAALIDKLCDEFERAQSNGLGPQLEAYVSRVPPEMRRSALLELLNVDIEIRRASGEQLDPNHYVARFPDLKEVVLDAFHQSDVVLGTVALEPPTVAGPSTKCDRRRPVSESASGQLKVRCPSCHAPIDVAVDTSLTDLTCATCGSHFSLVDQRQVTKMAAPLSKMGRFELIERIGVGGFGSVWKARDNELDRTVAVKLPRAGDMTADEQEKFFREARAAAQLRHPNIVSVHEVGRDGDSLYIVSDFVRGVTLGEWLTGQQLTSREAAELCAKIANALQHAHEQGVVHRDLKPGNIMMDGDSQPHLMDFGLARREAGEVTMTVEGQILGTPAYMSPEQAKGEGHQADRRSDVYSLGVVLFQLLTGELPFRGSARMIIHQVVHNEPRNPRSLNDRVPRDLDTICVKCLQKEPAKRYQKAAEVADDIGRYLTHQPIHARPVGRVERYWRWCRRNPVVASLTAIAVALLIIIAIVGWAGYHSTKMALDQASVNRQLAKEAVDDVLIGVTDSLVNVPQIDDVRKKLLRKALDYYKRLLEQKPDDIVTRREIALAYHRVGDIHRTLGEQNEAGTAYRQAVKQLTDLIKQYPNQTELRYHLGITYDYYGELLRDTDRFDEAKDAYRQALEIQNDLLNRADNNDNRQELARTLNNYGLLLKRTGKSVDAINELEQARSLLKKLADSDPKRADYQQELARTNINLGNLYKNSNRAAEAVEAYNEAEKRLTFVVRDNPNNHHYSNSLAACLLNHGNFLLNNKKPPDPKGAAEKIDKSVEILKTLIINYPYPLYKRDLARAYNSLGFAHEKERDVEAQKCYTLAREVCEPLIAEYPKNPEYQSLFGDILEGLAGIDERKKDFRQSLNLLNEAIEHQQTAIDLNPNNGDYKNHLAGHEKLLNEVKVELGRKDAAKQ